MNESSSILAVNLPCDEAVKWVIDRLKGVKLVVRRTFDLQIARHTQAACPCPHHGTDLCDCQMVVLLVYAHKGDPVSLIAHGNDNQTWFSLVDTPQQRADPRLEATIRNVMASSMLASIEG